MSSDDEDKEIEATKAPLMDHLIELRSRLIKALAAFFLAAIVCFFFARNIYNVLTWPYIWVAGAENSKFIYTGLLEYFVVQLCSARRFSRSRWSPPKSTCSSRRASIATNGMPFCPISSPRRSSSCWARWSSISWSGRCWRGFR
jgi:hypothetical protein